jgi:hypothetical protein
MQVVVALQGERQLAEASVQAVGAVPHVLQGGQRKRGRR